MGADFHGTASRPSVVIDVKVTLAAPLRKGRDISFPNKYLAGYLFILLQASMAVEVGDERCECRGLDNWREGLRGLRVGARRTCQRASEVTRQLMCGGSKHGKQDGICRGGRQIRTGSARQRMG